MGMANDTREANTTKASANKHVLTISWALTAKETSLGPSSSLMESSSRSPTVGNTPQPMAGQKLFRKLGNRMQTLGQSRTRTALQP